MNRFTKGMDRYGMCKACHSALVKWPREVCFMCEQMQDRSFMPDIEQVEPPRGYDAEYMWEQIKKREENMTALDTQVGGGHYKDSAIQPIEFIVANDIPYREANVIKYVFRWKSKNGIEDLRKAKHYIEMLIEEEMNAGVSDTQ